MSDTNQTALSPPASSSGPLGSGVILQQRYRIERLLVCGGMGRVYLARDQRLSNRPCAIKEMVDHFIDPQQRLEANEYFAREADTLAQLKHSAIPAITDRFDHQNRHYLVMEYVEGRNLEEELVARGGPLPEGLIIDIARQLCDVLAYLHGHEPPVIYRDMKPSHVMLTPKVRELRPETSANLANAIDIALSYDANRRPANIQQFRDMMLYGAGLPDGG